MELQGYAMIKEGAIGISPLPMSEFIGHPVRVLEFAVDGGAMVINPAATGIAMFEKEHIHRSFKCGKLGDIITPPGLNLIEQTMYVGKAMSRKGGYNYIVGQLVIASSLHKGEFSDHVLWAKQ